MSAYAELSETGSCGDEVIVMMRQLGAQVTRTSSFPPPVGHDRWSGDAVDELLATMFEKKGPAFVITCFTKATDDASLERLLLAAIHNFLIDEAKGTPRGKLRRRLGTLLSADARFVRADAAGGAPGWTLTGDNSAAWQGDVDTLLEAAFAVRGVYITTWNTSGPTPRQSVDAVLTVVHRVLTTAGGAVRDEDLARIVQARFAILTPHTFETLVDADTRGEFAAPVEDQPDLLVTTDHRAEEIWQSLSPTERAVFPHLGKPPADLAIITGAGPKAATAIADALAEKVRLATVDDPQHADVVTFLLQRCQLRP